MVCWSVTVRMFSLFKHNGCTWDHHIKIHLLCLNVPFPPLSYAFKDTSISDSSQLSLWPPPLPPTQHTVPHADASNPHGLSLYLLVSRWNRMAQHMAYGLHETHKAFSGGLWKAQQTPTTASCFMASQSSCHTIPASPLGFQKDPPPPLASPATASWSEHRSNWQWCHHITTNYFCICVGKEGDIRNLETTY